MAKCKYGRSPITGKHDHWWDDEKAECTKCKQIFSHSNYHLSNGKGARPVSPTCKPCTSIITFETRRKSMKRTTYRRYRYQMRVEGNDYDMTYEEFLEHWPKDNKCPILGHELRYFPIEERGKWKGGRHYPFTPCVDHIDPREELSKNNFKVISWRANELKSDAIPEELHLLSIYMNNMIPMGRDAINTVGYQWELEQSKWIGKYKL